MNIFDLYLEKIKSIIIDLGKKKKIIVPETFDAINAEIPPPKFDCDISTNVAMVLSKLNKTSPLELAERLLPEIKKNDGFIDIIKIEKPGFINIKFKALFWSNFTKDIIENSKNFGKDLKEKKNNYLVEFVSANPTGPLHVGHCRGAILGDVISNILIFNNHKVTKEYYVNDYGNQIINFTKSVYYRIREVKFNEDFPKDNPDLYPGDYLIGFAKNIVSSNSDLNLDSYEAISEKLTTLSIEQALLLIKKNLKSLGINHNNFVSEKSIVFNNEVENVVKFLEKNKFVYKGKIKAPAGENDNNWIEREQLLFKSTDFGDDKDRALQKSDGSWTYFASDVAYHKNKVDRKFDYLINILGADHAGYIKRISSSVEAISGKKDKLICKISDSVKEKSKDNPLYHVQYCYARISSVFRHINLDLNSEIELDKNDLEYSYDEIRILKKISEWPKCIDSASSKLEPHRIPVYLYELASEFHSYWNLGKQNTDKRFINENMKVSLDKLAFLKAISNVIKSGMDIVGVDTPEKM